MLVGTGLLGGWTDRGEGRGPAAGRGGERCPDSGRCVWGLVNLTLGGVGFARELAHGAEELRGLTIE
jgi:hypothetical protein